MNEHTSHADGPPDQHPDLDALMQTIRTAGRTDGIRWTPPRRQYATAEAFGRAQDTHPPAPDFVRSAEPIHIGPGRSGNDHRALPLDATAAQHPEHP
ncbi:hypothetical protein ACFZBU_39690 [Embleya sp. NPDC008237]|uniref:hypothetical protein n=1 Tax=Embleya sp. NPDC008237 TaxID=3363978 RepID=UPI0036E95AE5